MTTIAYHKESNTVAWDSRSTSGGIIISDEAQKRYEINGVYFWMCGAICDYQLFFDAYFGKEINLVPECDAIVYDNGEFYLAGVSNEAVPWKQPLSNNMAIGSGSQFAISAMKLGMNAKEAIEHAKTLDVYSGGEAHEFQPF